MTRRWLPFLLCLVVCLAAVHHSAARALLRVNEAAIKFLLEDGRTEVLVGVENSTGRAAAARVELELLTPRGQVHARAVQTETLVAGASTLRVPIQFSYAALSPLRRHEFPSYRLRYRIFPENASADAGASEGIVSISQIAPDIFNLQVTSSPRARVGTRYRARVHAAQLQHAQPMRGVAVEGVLRFPIGKSVVLKASATTDAEGDAVLDFELPRELADDGTLTVKARRGGFMQEAASDVELDDALRLIVTTDKSLYQPGQTLHVRALAFDSTRHAAADKSLTVKIQDPESTVVFRAPLKTSRFGVASADWPISENTRIGSYQVIVETEDETYGEGSVIGQVVKISRYELPNFTVGVKPDRTFYLAGQNAEVAVSGDYLFGQPVKRGHVRVVRQDDWQWNYREQKYDVTEGATVEGELDASGRFVAHLDLGDQHEDLAEDDERFRDLDYAAYVTDPTTNRTEQRRFSLRITRDPIHIYVASGRYRQAEGLPLAFYISTFYADGTPAPCEVAVRRKAEAKPSSAASGVVKTRAVEKRQPRVAPFQIRTNRYGVARVSGTLVERAEQTGDGRESSDTLSVEFSARDREGRVGHLEQDFWLHEGGDIRVETDKTLYRAGDPVALELTASEPELTVFVDVLRDGRAVASKPVRLHAGHGALTLPYTTDFKGRLLVNAYAGHTPESDERDESERGERTIIYQRNDELKLDLRFDRTDYRPGDEANAELSVSAPDGRTMESALGVVVFDKAVEERARTDAEFASSFGFGAAFYDFRYGAGEIAGITRRDVERLDLSKPVPAELETVAEILFNSSRSYLPLSVANGTSFDEVPGQLFRDLTTAQLKPLKDALAARYTRQAEYPREEAELRRLATSGGADFAALRDPWGVPYRAAFSFDRAMDTLDVMSDGADKKPHTADDFSALHLEWPYFRPTGERISRAVEQYHRRTGGYVRDAATLREELRRDNFDLDALRDRWGQPYALAFGISGMNYTVTLKSSGPDGVFQPDKDYARDDFQIWTAFSDYFGDARERIERALDAHLRAGGNFPQAEPEFRRILAAHGLDPEVLLRDGWNHPLQILFETATAYDQQIESSSAYIAGAFKPRMEVKPFQQILCFVKLRSLGADGLPQTYDEFSVAEISGVVLERRSGRSQASRTSSMLMPFAGETGAIRGSVKDPSGAAIADTSVVATHQDTAREFSTQTDADGNYLLRNLPAGLYTLRFAASGFITMQVDGVLVQKGILTSIDAPLQVGGATETVTVTSSSEVVNSSNATLSEKSVTISSLPMARSDRAADAQLSTPRLREFFPETLVWQPSIETDSQGRAHLRFKFADNITTWKLSVIGSNAEGEIGLAEREIRAFQPFFIEHDPPRTLTEGDEIELPVVLRNYLSQPQTIAVELKPESWFTISSAAHTQTDVAAGEAARAVFGFRAVSSVEDGKQRITATGAEAGDAVEKPVSVHPDGEEVSQTTAQIFNDTATLDAPVAADALPHTLRAELKIYPSLSAHVFESVEAIMRRPYGCGEQAISSSYPSLFVLRYYRRQRTGAGDRSDEAGGGKAAGAQTARAEARRADELPLIAQRAERNVQLGYERLLGYRTESGGFSYWGHGEADVALTAYAIRFLSDAREVVSVDHSVIEEARDWLVKEQGADGRWKAYAGAPAQVDARTAFITAYVAGVLARTAADSHAAPAARETDDEKAVKTSLKRALQFLAPRVERTDEPYLIASYALAALDAGQTAEATRATAKLRTLAHDEGEVAYWSLDTNTPFYGWGRAGRIETTALVVQALERVADARDDALAKRGMLFLMRNKDRYGVWHSTQATVNVLDTLIHAATAHTTSAPVTSSGATSGASGATPRASAASVAGASSNGSGGTAEIFVNGQQALSVALPSTDTLSAPVSVDLSRFFASTGSNRVEIRRTGLAQRTPAQAQLVTAYYVPWAKPAPVANTSGGASSSAASFAFSPAPSGASSVAPSVASPSPLPAPLLSLFVKFDRTEAAINQEINCHVEAARIDEHGYGMLLGEIGLPPGAEVDRASLDEAIRKSSSQFSHYDLLPDRLVIYLWPYGVKLVSFDFKFRPRFGLHAQSAPSQLYDYYNPEARALLAPTKFMVR